MKCLSKNSRNGTVNTFLEDVCASIKKAGIEDENFDKIGQRADSLQKSLNSAIKQDKAVSGLEELDSVRDEKLRAVGKILEGFSAIPSEEIAGSAKELLSVFLKYGFESAVKSYDEESSDIKSMKEDFEKAERVAKIKALPGFEKALSELWAAEDAFREKKALFVSSLSVTEKSATAVKKEAVSFVNSCLIPYVESVCYVRPDFEPFKKELATYIARLV